MLPPPGSLFFTPRLDLVLQIFFLLVCYFSFIHLSPLLCSCLSGIIVFQYWTSAVFVASQDILNALPMSEEHDTVLTRLRWKSEPALAAHSPHRAASQGQDHGHAVNCHPVKLRFGREQQEAVSHSFPPPGRASCAGQTSSPFFHQPRRPTPPQARPCKS